MSSTAPDIFAHLQASHGNMSVAQLLVWANFIEASVEALRRAEAAVRAASSAYGERNGWWRKSQKKNASKVKVRIPNEEAITDAIGRELEGIRMEASAGCPLYDMNVVFDTERPRKKQVSIGPNALTTDIRVYTYLNPNIDLRFESKIFFDECDLDKEYLSDRGLLRFADQESPYTDRIIGGMIGYSLTKTRSIWESAVEGRLPSVGCASAVTRTQLSCEADATVVCDVARPDPQLPKVTVLHLVMEFETDPSSRP